MQKTTLPTLDVAASFHALSDPLRVKILEVLRQRELCVCELCEELEVTQSKLSFHLKTLKAANLVRSYHEGRWIYYSLNLPRLVELEQYLADFRRYSLVAPARLCKEN